MDRTVFQNFANILSSTFPAGAGWTFQSSVNELSDSSLVIHTYDVQGTAARVGADFHVEYVPHAGDPTVDVHWIQVVTDNHALPGNLHGTLENEVDNPFSPGGRSPYHDDGAAATSREFYDFPGRTDTNRAHDWTAELFLVTGPAAEAGPGNIIFHGGITWGWSNIPEPSLAYLLAILIVFHSIGRKRVA
ncbi:MAG: hypothetical protein O3A87_01140 [Verrucomicrobia bacterium]|nr:hypothetical protein [Verrucomicrobiota bacterium]MDA1005075.1 hypothetical protein [Verrucomicrobiota bacterium]